MAYTDFRGEWTVNNSLSNLNRWIIVGGIASIVAIALGVCWPVREEKPRSELPLALHPIAIDFGVVFPISDLRIPLKLKNPLKQSIIVEGFSASCGCAKVYPSTIEIKPLEERTVEAHLDLTEIGKSIDEARDFAVRITPRCQTIAVNPIIIGGKIRRPFQGLPLPLDIGIVDGDQQAVVREFKFKIDSNISGCTVSSPNPHITPEVLISEPGLSAVLRITLNAAKLENNLPYVLVIQCDSRDHKKPDFTCTLPLQMHVDGPPSLLPATLVFPATRKGAGGAREESLLKHRKGAKVSLSKSNSITTSSFKLTKLTTIDEGTVITVDFTPQILGNIADVLEFSIEEENGDASEIKLFCKGYSPK